MPLPATQPPPAVVHPAPSAQEAEAELLKAFDWEQPLPPAPKLKGAAAPSYRWLRAAATFDPALSLPDSPFATGQRRAEAEALRRLLKAPVPQVGQGLRALPIHESGTALALWRWGRVRLRTGAWEASLRKTWEDRLLRSGPALTRGYALRHALCWALAEQDEARFTELRAKAGEGNAETCAGFQQLFGLPGAPSPVLRLWTLPGLDYRDLRLDELGFPRIWICPLEEGPLRHLPKDTAWIIPSAAGELDPREAALSDALRSEGKQLASRLEAAGRTAFFAPSRDAFLHLGLAWFPILIDLDGKGNIRAIRMGDAAPARP